ncbi:hypothetical protein RFN29_24920 [Mesorhizobium sp. VK22B]|uniref:Nif11 domain-containing protein n=1 Tax=Mesorhizobium captivum TaxID=3072319 RepID=A0ABU4Z763_9HYPH|nr:hypothetical protein [Mesorhizobium sp. VK22B]MDX8494808.1 hypothetical protein [Mesorhizobium sp. VK22B]
MSELRQVIGALQSEVEFEAAVSELGAAGIDRSRISFLAQEEIAVSCAGAVGCDVKQLPRVEIGMSDDRQQVRTLATSLAATVASFAGAGVVLAATGGAAAPARWPHWLPGVALEGWPPCSASAMKLTSTSGPKAKSSMGESY